MKFALNVLEQKNTTGSSIRIAIVIMALAAMFFLSGAASWAAGKSVSEKILDILREKGDISDQQYEELKKQAEAEQAEQEEQGEWRTYWKDGLRVESKDGKIKTRWGGRVQVDWGAIDADGEFEQALEDAGENGPLTGNGVEFRRLRFYSRGTLYETMGYRLQIDFADFDVDVKDAYIDFIKVPYVGNNVLRIGHAKEPISLEELASSNNITFMERAMPVLAFAPSRNTGVMLWNNVLDQRLLWQAGFYYNTDDNGAAFNNFSNTNLSARVAGTPWYQDKSHLLHLGLGYSHKFRNEAKKRYGLIILNFTVTSNHIHLLVYDGKVNVIPKSIQLIAGRTGREYNQRKKRKGAFWEDRYHATAVKTGNHLIRCLAYIDLNMVRAGAVQHPEEWMFGGYHEIQNPNQRYSLINRQKLTDLLTIKDSDQLSEYHRNWIEEVLRNGLNQRDAKWTESIAVGDKDFVIETKAKLGAKAIGRRELESDEGYELKEQQSPYSPVFTPKKSTLSLKNDYIWQIS